MRAREPMVVRTRTNPSRRVRRKLNHGQPAYPDTDCPNGSTDNNGINADKDPSRIKFLVGLDYGTTYTSVSYLKLDLDHPPKEVTVNHIKSVRNWSPVETQRYAPSCPIVPSESWYHDGQYFWGYEVRQRLRNLDILETGATKNIIRFAKLLLDDSGRQDDDEMGRIKQILVNIGKSPEDVVKDYLTKVFAHSKDYMHKNAGFSRNCQVELALCIPSGWSSGTKFRLQKIVMDVVEETEFAGSNFSIYIVEEPEAAATRALHDDGIREAISLQKEKKFIVCDAGGGTVDTITYHVRQTNPLRFDELVKSQGACCGSSYITQALLEEVRYRLEKEEYLGEREKILEDQIFLDIEYEIKRNYGGPGQGSQRVSIPGLQADTTKDLGEGFFYITDDQMQSYFAPRLQEIVYLIDCQLANAKKRLSGNDVDILLLVGAFSRSKALRSHLATTYENLSIPQEHIGAGEVDMGTVVSHGAVLSALNKEDSPMRILDVNFGFLVYEEYNPHYVPHREVIPFHSPEDGKQYVKNCIQWKIRKSNIAQDRVTYRDTLYQFFRGDEDLVLCQKLYYSDKTVFNHYKVTHPKNRHARVAGVVEADVTSLVDEGKIKLIPAVSEGLEYYRVDYELELVVEGKNINAFIRAPPQGECRGQAQICIAAAFKPRIEGHEAITED